MPSCQLNPRDPPQPDPAGGAHHLGIACMIIPHGTTRDAGVSSPHKGEERDTASTQPENAEKSTARRVDFI